MFNVLQLSIFLLMSSCAIDCLQWVGPSPTLQGQASSTSIGVGTEPTQGPEYDLLKRVDSIPASICGWYAGQGYSESWYMLGTTNTCFFYTDIGVFGSSYDTWTKCVDFTAATTYSCDNACHSSSRVLLCSSDNPYCQTVLLGTSYSEFLCITQSSNTVLLASTYAGQTNPIAFPIYSGSQGISIGTAYPSGYTTPGPTTSSATTSVTSSSPSSTITSSTSSSSLGSTSDVPSSPQPIGAIVGGAVGGVIAICITVIIVALIMRRQRHRNEVPFLETSTQHHQTANQDVQSPYFSKPELDVPTQGLSSHPFGHEVAELGPGHRYNVAGSVAVHEVQGT